MSAEVKHLWEYDHPYYCSEGNWFKRDQHTLFGSWDEFVDTTMFYGGDRDQNLLIRWDWISWPGGIPTRRCAATAPTNYCCSSSCQRKALQCSVAVAVTDEDEPRVRLFLEECAETMRATWEPLLAGPAVHHVSATGGQQ